MTRIAGSGPARPAGIPTSSLTWPRCPRRRGSTPRSKGPSRKISRFRLRDNIPFLLTRVTLLAHLATPSPQTRALEATDSEITMSSGASRCLCQKNSRQFLRDLTKGRALTQVKAGSKLKVGNPVLKQSADKVLRPLC